MSMNLTSADLHRIGQEPLAQHDTRAHLAFAAGTPNALGQIARAASEAQPPNRDALAAVYGACIAHAGTRAQMRGRSGLAREYKAVADQVLRYLAQ